MGISWYSNFFSKGIFGRTGGIPSEIDVIMSMNRDEWTANKKLFFEAQERCFNKDEMWRKFVFLVTSHPLSRTDDQELGIRSIPMACLVWYGLQPFVLVWVSTNQVLVDPDTMRVQLVKTAVAEAFHHWRFRFPKEATELEMWSCSKDFSL
jgi:hypothetical protein